MTTELFFKKEADAIFQEIVNSTCEEIKNLNVNEFVIEEIKHYLQEEDFNFKKAFIAVHSIKQMKKFADEHSIQFNSSVDFFSVDLSAELSSTLIKKFIFCLALSTTADWEDKNEYLEEIDQLSTSINNFLKVAIESK